MRAAAFRCCPDSSFMFRWEEPACSESGMTTYSKSAPWYRRYEHAPELALLYMKAIRRIQPDSPHEAQVRSYVRLSWVRMVFESNRVEDAGLYPEEATRKVIDEFMPTLPTEFVASRRLRSGDDPARDIIDAIEIDRLKALSEGFDLDNVILTVSHGGHSRGVREVVQHARALGQASYHARLCVLRRTLTLLVRAGLPDDEAAGMRDELDALGEMTLGQDDTFGSTMLRRLHAILAKDLLDADAGVEPGEFRIDDRMVPRAEIAFPAPELVPAAVEVWSERMNALAVDPAVSAITMAARASYDFVAVHPFPDLNGRLSRILLNVALWLHGLPFAVALRAESKGKKRYMAALRYANRGNIAPYEVLISLALIDGARHVDGALAMAGAGSLLDLLPDESRERARRLCEVMGYEPAD